MTHVYKESYLNKAQKTLAAMMDFAVFDLNYKPDEFFILFLQSGIDNEFGRGNPKYIAGKSGAELAREVVFITNGQLVETTPTPRFDRSPIYWAGWALAYYQWYSGHSFKEIHKVLPFAELLLMYPAFHEADINKFVSTADELLRERENIGDTNLSRLRKARGLSQKELSDASGVALRMIQLYEQRQNDINKAQAVSLNCLAQALGCKMEDLFEQV
jgi:DNA-binding transcriptional regulator YiaG